MDHFGNPLLITKLYRPRRRATSIARPRLLHVLDRGQDSNWILVVAAAGMGKTTLIVDWTEIRDAKTCWLTLDRSDDEPTRFFTYLVAAIQQCESLVSANLLNDLRSTTRETLDDIINVLLNELAMLSEHLVIVLDDYHVIESDQIHQAMTRLLSHQSAAITFVMITRADPPFPLARMRANHELIEVRAEDLAFTQAEAADFFRESFSLNLTSDQVDALCRRTEGWGAGLQLAALALQNHMRDTAQFIHNFTGSNHHVLDYLMEEVLHKQPDKVRDFMMYTSPLKQFNAPLCNALMDAFAPNSINVAETLSYLETHNLFLVPLDDSRQWYRYHHLFAELLRAQLVERDATAMQKIQKSTAEWHSAQGDQEQAIDYAFNAGAVDYAAELIQAHLAAAMWPTSLATWQRWHHLLPADFVMKYPIPAAIFGHMLVAHGRIPEAINILGQLDRDLLSIQSQLGLDYLNVDDVYSAEDLTAIAAESRKQPLNHIAHIVLALVLRTSGDYQGASKAMDEASVQCQRAGDDLNVVNTLLHRGRLHAFAGYLRQAYDLCCTALEATASIPAPLMDLLGIVYTTMGRVLLAWNELEEAERYLRLAISHAEKTGFVIPVLPSATMLLAETLQAQGNYEAALSEVETAIEHTRRYDFPSEGHWIQIYKVQIQLRQGVVAHTNSWLKQRNTLPPSRYYLHRIHPLTEAQIALAQGQTAKSIEQLTALTTEPSDLLTADIWLLLALARQADGDGQHAIVAMTTAISIAEPENNKRAFLNYALVHGTALSQLLTRLYREQPNNHFVADLLAQLPNASIAPAANATLIEPLGERELDVLRLIVAGYANKEIAEELVLALNTVKWYIKVLYSKLQVKSRSQAIARARELNLIDSQK